VRSGSPRLGWFDLCAAPLRSKNCSGAAGGPVQVWTMKQNGTDKHQVTYMSGPAIFPDFSPDGSKIVFTAKPAGSPTRDIYVIGSDGSGRTHLTNGVGNNAYPGFSPDGSKIVFTSERTVPGAASTRGTWTSELASVHVSPSSEV
jgi:Tol biopolymer transport system component